MKVFDDAWHREDLPTGAVATIGNYDGVHLGQRAVLDKVIERSRELGVPSAVVTFEPHPAKLLSPEWAPRCLTTASQKRDLLAACGIERMFVLRFDEELARVGAPEFVESFLHARLDLREIYVGSRFVFGHEREGNLELLQELGGAQHPASGVRELTLDGLPISSTRIREAVATGEVETAASLLGRPYELTGVVAKGAGKGRELGWPTINLATDNELFPAHGVYVATTRLEDDELEAGALPSVANVGVRPTVHADSPATVECHLLDFEAELYGRPASVRFLERLRGEQRFPSLDALRSQIAQDVAAARRRFAPTPDRELAAGHGMPDPRDAGRVVPKTGRLK